LPAQFISMKYLFFVQSEGRGHMTQALALKEKLEARGHIIVAVIVGTTNLSQLPSFFKKEFSCPLYAVESPRFIVDKQGKGIKVFASTLITIWRIPRYLNSLKKIKKIIADLQPDILINFYEPLAGNYYRLTKDQRPLFCIGHQHFISHPAFRFPKISLIARLSFKFYNRLAAPARSIKIALSFTAETDQPQKKLFVCPPLIRKVFLNQIPTTQNFILVYLLNAGYHQEIIDWCQKNPEQKITAFWDKFGEAETYFGSNLSFHYLDGEKFIAYLTTCSAYASTAGFDSIAEAAYLQKNVLMVPTINHFEQKCNAIDAQRAGIASTADNFNISLLKNNQQKTHSPEALQLFKKWVDDYNDKIVTLLEN